MKVIDFECDTPTAEAVKDTIRLIEEGRGFDKEGYAQNMAPGWAAQIGMTLEEFNAAKEKQGLTSLALKLCEVDMKNAMSHEDVIQMLDVANVEFACIGIHLLSDRAHDYAHPKNLDQVARDFPELTIVAGLAGWPWVSDLVAIATRHKNIYIDFACRRVKHLITPGSGYEMLIYYGNRILQDKILFASGWGTLQIPLTQLIAECDELPLKDSVRQKWMHDNAARVLRL